MASVRRCKKMISKAGIMLEAHVHISQRKAGLLPLCLSRARRLDRISSLLFPRRTGRDARRRSAPYMELDRGDNRLRLQPRRQPGRRTEHRAAWLHYGFNVSKYAHIFCKLPWTYLTYHQLPCSESIASAKSLVARLVSSRVFFCSC